MHVCKYLKQRVRRIDEQNRKSFKGFSKKIHMKRYSFITQFKIEFLLPFTGCKKVLGKMPVGGIFTEEASMITKISTRFCFKHLINVQQIFG